jgi:hypothetical protein
VFLDEPILESGYELNLRNYGEAQNGSDEDREFLGSFESDDRGLDSFLSDQSDDRESDSVSTEDGLEPQSLESGFSA